MGSPPPKVEWSRAGNVHSADTSLAFQEQGCLELNTVEFNSHGKYVCRARNRIGLAETTTSVVVKEKGAPLINNMICYHSSYRTLISF